MKTCKIEGCSNKIWSKGACLYHAPKSPISKKKSLSDFLVNKLDKSSISKNTVMKKKASSTKSEGNVLMKEFFQKVWATRKHYCEITGAYLGNECLSIYLHHILSKSKYPEAKFDEENLIILHGDIHASVEADMYKYAIINERREYLLKKYGYE